MIIVSGATGFIGSCLIQRLNSENFNYIIAVDEFGDEEKEKNLTGKTIQERVSKEDLNAWLEKNHRWVEFWFHCDEDEDQSFFETVWKAGVDYQIPLIYTSQSGKTDKRNAWAEGHTYEPFYWAGLNVESLYGPNEEHRFEKASFVYQLFKHGDHISEVPSVQSDFLYVKDLTEIMAFLMRYRKHSGVYNLGSATSHSLQELAEATFEAMNKQKEVAVNEISGDSTSSNDLAKIQSFGFDKPLHTLKEGIEDYVKNYLVPNKKL